MAQFELALQTAFHPGEKVKLKRSAGWHSYQLRTGKVIEVSDAFPPLVTVKWANQTGQYKHPPGDLVHVSETA
jgi:hypothetical protein